MLGRNHGIQLEEFSSERLAEPRFGEAAEVQPKRQISLDKSCFKVLFRPLGSVAFKAFLQLQVGM